MELRKERKLTFLELSKALAEKDVYISHTNLKNYEISDPDHPLFGRTSSMSIEYLVAFADFYDVSVDFLLGNSDTRKTEYENIAEQLGLSEETIDKLIHYKQVSEENGNTKLRFQRDTAIIDDFISSISFDYMLEKVKHSLFAEFMNKLSHNEQREFLRVNNAHEIEKAKEILNKHGYFAVENDVIANVQMDNAIREMERYFRSLREVI